MNKTRVVIFGLGPKFKGGIANYTTSLAVALDKQANTEVFIVSWTQQYPALIPRDFVDRSSKTDLLEGTDVKIDYLTNYNIPTTWQKTVQHILALKPDILIFQWSIALQGLPISFMAKKLSKHPKIEIIFDLHFVIQKESSLIDNSLTKLGIKSAKTYIVHSQKTANELKQLFPNTDFTVDETGKRDLKSEKKSVIKLYHPIYDMFKPDPNFDIAAEKKRLGLKKNVFLFFGFIRKYKGLHNAIKAFAKVREQRDDVSLLIVGESMWDTLDPNKLSTKIKLNLFKFLSSVLISKGDSGINYRPLDLVEKLDLTDSVAVVNSYVPTEDVHKYFQVSDSLLLFYLTATPSGVESMAANFGMPILAARVGHFSETIENGFNGYLAEPENIESMCKVMLDSIENPIQAKNVEKKAVEMSWHNYAKAILAAS